MIIMMIRMRMMVAHGNYEYHVHYLSSYFYHYDGFSYSYVFVSLSAEPTSVITEPTTTPLTKVCLAYYRAPRAYGLFIYISVSLSLPLSPPSPPLPPAST